MLKTIDLFAGAGGLSLGFQLTGKFDILAAAEINENAKATYKANIAKDKEDFVFIDNVVGYNFRNLDQQLGGIDVVIGGPPCQGFSNANRQKNSLISMNNGLVKEFFRAIKEIKPKAFIMENVGMLRSDTHRFYESEKDNDVIAALWPQQGTTAMWSGTKKQKGVMMNFPLNAKPRKQRDEQLNGSSLTLQSGMSRLPSLMTVCG